MQRRSLLCLPVALAACASAPSRGARLDGRWQPVSARLGGREFPIAGFRGAILVLQPQSYEFGADRGLLLLRPTATPAQMDIQGSAGPNAGKSIAAIYTVNEDELVVCYQLGSGPRPASFESPAGTQVLLVRYRRLA